MTTTTGTAGTMRAVIVDPERSGWLTLGDVPRPAPTPAETLVRVTAFSLNRGEVRMSRSPRPHWRPGWDLAGVVEQAAADGTGPAAGTRVVGIVRSGAWAEYAAVPTDQLAPLPDAVPDAQAATLPVAGLTALHVLIKGGFLLERPVLVTGATGGVGEYALQLGRLAGAKMVAHVRRPDQEAFARAAGAHEVVIGESIADAAEFGAYALVIDSVGGTVLGEVMGVLTDEGTTVVSIGTSGGGTVTFDAAHFYGVGMTRHLGMFLFDELKAVESARAGLTRLAGLVAQGRLRATVSVEADWSEAERVATDLLERRYPGKAVLYVR